MMARRIAGTWLVVILGGCACDPSFLDAFARDDTTPELRRAVYSWLTCSECDGGELERVLQHGDAGVPLLSGVLREGIPARDAERYLPPPAQSDARSLTMFVATPSAAAAEVETTATRHRTRAAEALLALATPAATSELRRTDRSALPASVQRRVERMLDQ